MATLDEDESTAQAEDVSGQNPVIDGVEGTYTATEGLAKDGYRLVGNVPPSGKAPGGMLRHRGWKTKAGKIVAPAELEIE